MTLYEKLVAVQTQMKAPKNMLNTYGGYKYRNAEGIFEAFKPFGAQLGLFLVVTDEVVEIGGHCYVKATATLGDMEKPGIVISVSSLAREADSKKGMDSAQVTGATSSYARKYALNGLFLLDDTKDPDTDEYRKQDAEMQKRQKPAEAAPYPAVDEMKKDCKAYYKGDNLKKMLQYFGVGSIDDMNSAQLMKAWDTSRKGGRQ